MGKGRDYFSQMGYSEEEINHHYKAVKYKNDKNKIKYKELEEEYKTEIEKAKKHFKKVKVSLHGDGFFCNTKFGNRTFIYFYDLDETIKLYSN